MRLAPMEVICVSCGAKFTRHHGKFPKYCSVQCRKPTDVAATIAKFSKVVNSGCIEWTGSILSSGGYGQLAVNGQPKRAHRVAYELSNGPIPKGMFVCHRCDNPKCVNVDHLFLGTNADNMRDCKSKNRTRSGAKCLQSKLTPAIVRKMRKQKGSGATFRELANKFNVSVATAYNAITKRTWQNI